jgi:hypothetical protein
VCECVCECVCLCSGIIPEGGVADLLRAKARAQATHSTGSIRSLSLSPDPTAAAANPFSDATVSPQHAHEALANAGRHESCSSHTSTPRAGFLMAWINSADNLRGGGHRSLKPKP